jgi:hypothetical protein
MSSELPPNPDVNFFNNEYWVNEATPLTQQVADTKYLRFPVAQGNEELLDVNVLGNATFQNTLSIANGANTSIFDMNASNNLTINNNTNGGSIFFNIKDATSGAISNTLSLTTGSGLNSGCSLTPLTNANVNCFTASSATSSAIMYMGISG